MSTIYKIENKINHKVYIGKTIRDVTVRWQEHIRESLNQQDNIPLHNAIRKYGIENFDFSIIEDNIENVDKLNQREKEYIIKYNSLSHEKGYNVAKGGDGGRISTKITEEEAEQIQNILADKNCLLSFQEIGKQFNLSNDAISAINSGQHWHNNNIKYPIRDYSVIGLTLTRDTYANIVNDILNPELKLKDIQQKYNLSEDQMTAINQGKYCYSNHKYYEGIYNGDFPIRKDMRVKTPDEDFIPIFYDVLFTPDSMAKIGKKYGVQGNTIQYIINGHRRKDLTKSFIIPMRKNLEENKEIFNKLYPDYKGGC